MKKIVLTLISIFAIITVLQAREWNIPKGAYTCEIISTNDADWNTVVYYTKKQRKENISSFVLGNTTIVYASGEVFTDIGDYSKYTNILVNTEGTIALYIPAKSKKDDYYGIGMATLKKGNMNRKYMHCTRK